MIATPLPFRLVAEQLRPPFGPMQLAWRYDLDDGFTGDVYLVQAIHILWGWN